MLLSYFNRLETALRGQPFSKRGGKIMGGAILLILIFMGVGCYVTYLIFRGIFRSGFKALGKAQTGVMERTLEKKSKTDAVATLNNRLALGEITQDEYRQLRTALEAAEKEFPTKP